MSRSINLFKDFLEKTQPKKKMLDDEFRGKKKLEYRIIKKVFEYLISNIDNISFIYIQFISHIFE